MPNKLLKYSWLKRVILNTIVLSFALLWGEAFTTILLPQNVDSKMNILASDPVNGYIYMPNASTYEKGREYNALYRINSLGLRDREYGPKKEGVFRVLLLGDSFSVSHGLAIEDSLSRQMERALQEVADTQVGTSVKFEVINTAVGGYSPYNYWKAYLRWAPVFKPDLVLLGLSPDDYDSSNEELIYIIEDGSRVASFREGHEPKKRGGSLVRKLRKWLSWNSDFYILLRNFFYYNKLVGRLSAQFAPKSEARLNQLQQFMSPQPDIILKYWAKSFSYLEKLHESTSADNVELIIIPIPLKEEIDTAVFQRTLTACGLRKEQMDINQPLDQIAAFCKKRNIPLLDPRAAIKARNLEAPCYFVYDGHWIPEGIHTAVVSIAHQWFDLHLPPWNKIPNREDAENKYIGRTAAKYR
ncbi:MAG: hypothetical protein WBN77_09380 [Desulfobacterales bacterium]